MTIIVNTNSNLGRADKKEVKQNIDIKKKEKIMAIAKVLGLDVGTSNTVLAKLEGEQINYTTIRTAFLDIEDMPMFKNMLNRQKIPFMVHNKKLYIIGESAIETAGAYSKEVKRPMKKGILVAKDQESVMIMRHLIETIVGKGNGEKICYSSPEIPLDEPDFDTLYHKELIGKILKDLGYIPMSINESHALSYSELVKYNFTGLNISFGAGMTNAVLTINGVPVVTISVAKGGDYIDRMTSKMQGITETIVQIRKETGVDLTAPKDNFEQALVFYYKNLIRFVIEKFIERFNASSNIFIKKPIPVVIAGGTSKAVNFNKIFTETLNELGKLPFEIETIIMASDPINTIAKGLLFAAAESETK